MGVCVCVESEQRAVVGSGERRQWQERLIGLALRSGELRPLFDSLSESLSRRCSAYWQ